MKNLKSKLDRLFWDYEETAPLIGKTDCRNLSFHKGALSSFKKHIGKTLNV